MLRPILSSLEASVVEATEVTEEAMDVKEVEATEATVVAGDGDDK